MRGWGNASSLVCYHLCDFGQQYLGFQFPQVDMESFGLAQQFCDRCVVCCIRSVIDLMLSIKNQGDSFLDVRKLKPGNQLIHLL